MTSTDDFVELLYRAKEAPIGILVDYTSSFERVRTTFASAKRRVKDPALEEIQVRRSPFGVSQLYLIRGDVAKALAKPKELPAK